LRPKHYKEFKTGIANKVGVHQDVVDDFVAFYYSKLRSSLSNVEYPNISVFGLGIFTLRKQKLDNAIKKNKSCLGNLEKNTFNGYKKHLGVIEKLELLEKAKTKMNELHEERKNFKAKKNEN